MAASLAKSGAIEPSSDDKQRMWLSCQQGCAAGTPFMFNWTHPSLPGDIAAYAANPFLSGSGAVWGHPYAISPAHRPQNHASCVMSCLSMGKDAMDQDCMLNPKLERCNFKGTRKLQRRRLLMNTAVGAAAKSRAAKKPCTSEEDCKMKRDIASQKVSQSCMQGCTMGKYSRRSRAKPLETQVAISGTSHVARRMEVKILGRDSVGNSVQGLPYRRSLIGM